MKNQGFNDCRYKKIIYVHCGEETSVRDPAAINTTELVGFFP